jgi:Protein of unknown function (DUF2442)
MLLHIRPVDVPFHDGKLGVTLADERMISTPLHWYPWLAKASSEHQTNLALLPDAIYWTDLNEGLEIEGILRGIRPSTTIY